MQFPWSRLSVDFINRCFNTYDDNWEKLQLHLIILAKLGEGGLRGWALQTIFV